MADEIAISHISDEEMLYRSIPVGRGWVRIAEGQCKPSSQAFNDALNEPSVDRAVLLKHNPQLAKLSESDGVLQLKTAEVRKTTVVRTEQEPGRQKTEVVLNVDVVHDPLNGRPSHALIKFHPVKGGSSNFNKLKERLAKLATWAPQAEISRCE
jgi:hypothetical protein